MHMHQQPLLSIILTVRNQRSIIEPTFSSLYEMNALPFELFVIEDASTDGSNDAIHSLLDYYEHDQTYYFEHRDPTGRGSSLNEALQQCNGSVVWTPQSIEAVDEVQLMETVTRLHNSECSFFYACPSIPSTITDWIQLIEGDGWPGEGEFLWNLQRIPSTQCFFNPYLSAFHSFELAERLGPSGNHQKTDSWHSPSGLFHTSDVTVSMRKELACTLMRRPNLNVEQRREILVLLDELGESEQPRSAPQSVEQLLSEAHKMQQDGRFSVALELVEHILGKQPGHQQANQLKIEILKRKRRFVEVSELKHELSASARLQSPSEEQHAETKFKTSLIIPTALYGKPALEHCLISVSEHCNSDTTELIIIDNASLDDTHEYLSELQENQFFHCQVITNKQNSGFAASVNQGLEKAQGTYACIMHNDVELSEGAIGRLEELMDANPEFAIVGPLADQTLNPEQLIEKRESHNGTLAEAEYLDSFCMMLRMETNLRLDENFQKAFFDDIDLCFQAQEQGSKVGVALDVSVKHHFGTTTYALNLDTESKEYWKNARQFNEKWDVEVFSEEELKSQSRFDQLMMLSSIVNPLYPEDEIIEWFEQLFTDEVRTEILKSDHEPEVMFRLVYLMMVMDQREVMRRLEDKMENLELPVSLTYQLIRFYFNRNIYSRCIYYLDQLESDQRSLQSELYRLQIMVNEKEFESAVPKLKKMLESIPDNPMLYKLAGDIYQFQGNEEEATSFYHIAHQLNPFDYSEEGLEELKL